MWTRFNEPWFWVKMRFNCCGDFAWLMDFVSLRASSSSWVLKKWIGMLLVSIANLASITLQLYHNLNPFIIQASAPIISAPTVHQPASRPQKLSLTPIQK